MTGAAPLTSTVSYLNTLIRECRALGPLGEDIATTLDKVPLSLETTPSTLWYDVTHVLGIQVFIDQAEGLCMYAGLSVASFYLLGTLLGLTQWRALMLNPLLVEEDFRHARPSKCLFAVQEEKCGYALVLEKPFICTGCIEFYCCLGAEKEILAVQRLLQVIRQDQRALT